MGRETSFDGGRVGVCGAKCCRVRFFLRGCGNLQHERSPSKMWKRFRHMLGFDSNRGSMSSTRRHDPNSVLPRCHLEHAFRDRLLVDGHRDAARQVERELRRLGLRLRTRHDGDDHQGNTKRTNVRPGLAKHPRVPSPGSRTALADEERRAHGNAAIATARRRLRSHEVPGAVARSLPRRNIISSLTGPCAAPCPGRRASETAMTQGRSAAADQRYCRDRDTLISMPSPTIRVSTLLPPALKYGKVMPETGTICSTMPMLIATCQKNNAATPEQSSAPKRSRACEAMLIDQSVRLM